MPKDYKKLSGYLSYDDQRSRASGVSIWQHLGSGLVSRYCLTAIAYHGHPRWHTTLTYDGLDHLVTITERDGQDIQTQHLLWCGEAICGLTDDKGQLFTRLFQQGEWHQGQVLYYAKDHLGSIRDVLGTLPPEGELIHLASYDYGPYGERLDEGRGRRLGSGGAGLGQSARPDEQAMGGGAVPDVSASPEPQDKRHAAIQSTLGYAGMFYHARSGLYLTHYRAYDPRLGRWLSRDPIWEAGGINLYGYVGGDPVGRTDPTGLAPKPLPPERTRTRNCNGTEYAACQQLCSSRGVQSCKVSQTWRIKSMKKGLTLWGWYDGPMSCSCNDPDDFCSRSPTTCAVGAGVGICILIFTPWPDDVLIPLLIGGGAAATQ